MDFPLSVSSAVADAADLRTRCFRTIFLVANSWTLVGGMLNLFTLDATTRMGHRVHLAGGGSLIVAAAIYSVALPLWYVTRKP